MKKQCSLLIKNPRKKMYYFKNKILFYHKFKTIFRTRKKNILTEQRNSIKDNIQDTYTGYAYI